jgi:hypothetical protein
MDDPYTFWTQYPAGEALRVVSDLLGGHVRYHNRDRIERHRHHFWRIGYAPEFDLAGVKKQLRQKLDELDWQFITTGRVIYKGEELPTFGIAPILPIKVAVGYHATRACKIGQIEKEGLKPSNEERRATDYPDTEGVIHICAKLEEVGGKDSAEWWREELSKKNRFGDTNWGILRIEMSSLPAEARVYQDMHSASGIIVDRIETIPGNLISKVP